jgi:isopentenyl-diphosphate delta-isomerase
VGPQLTEHEYDHVFVGVADGITIDPNPDEVAEWRWATVPALRTNVAEAPGQYTVWFRRLLNPVLADAAPARAAGPPLDAPDAE